MGDELINVTVMCWCDGTGVAKPMKPEKNGGFRCKLCGGHVSAALFEESGKPIPMSPEGKVQQTLRIGK